MLVTPDKSGASVAGIVRLLHPKNASSIEVQAISPHCSMVMILDLSPVLLKRMRGNVPVMEMVYVPAAEYVCVASPVTPVLELPSPQFTS